MLRITTTTGLRKGARKLTIKAECDEAELPIYRKQRIVQIGDGNTYRLLNAVGGSSEPHSFAEALTLATMGAISEALGMVPLHDHPKDQPQRGLRGCT